MAADAEGTGHADGDVILTEREQQEQSGGSEPTAALRGAAKFAASRWMARGGSSVPQVVPPRLPRTCFGPPGSYEWWCAPAREEPGVWCGFPARREEHSLEWYEWTYKNQPPKAFDGPTDVEDVTIGVFACGKNHVWGFGPNARQADPDVRRFKDQYVLSDNFMFEGLAKMMGDANANGPPNKVPEERWNAVWCIDCCDIDQCGSGSHIGKHPDILRRVYDSREWPEIRRKLARFVEYVRHYGRS